MSSCMPRPNCWPICGTLSSWWPGQRSRCWRWLSWWPAVAPLHAFELVALAGVVGRLHQAELLALHVFVLVASLRSEEHTSELQSL